MFKTITQYFVQYKLPDRVGAVLSVPIVKYIIAIKLQIKFYLTGIMFKGQRNAIR